MSLATEEIDSEQSGQQSLQQQLEKTNELVSVLTKQLAYMKEAVCLIFKYYFHIVSFIFKRWQNNERSNNAAVYILYPTAN